MVKTNSIYNLKANKMEINVHLSFKVIFWFTIYLNIHVPIQTAKYVRKKSDRHSNIGYEYNYITKKKNSDDFF